MKKETIAYFENQLKRHHNGEKLTAAENKACQAFENSRREGWEDFVLTDFLWETEIAEFAAEMRAAQIESFVITNHSTALMENLHGFHQQGMSIAELTYIERENRLHKNGIERIPGIRIRVA